MSWHDLLFAFSGFVSEILGTLSGFGSSTFFVPIAQMLESFHLVLVLTSFLHSFGNISRIFYFRRYFKKELFFKFAIPFIIFSGLGALLTSFVPVVVLTRVLGFALILISLLFFVKKSKTPNKYVQRFNIPLMALSGFSTGLIGTGGAIRGVALASLHIEKNLFIALSSSVDLGGDLLRLSIYLWQGFMDWSQWYYIPLLAVAAWAGAKVGSRLIARVPQELFLKIVTVFVFISGVGLLLK